MTYLNIFFSFLMRCSCQDICYVKLMFSGCRLLCRAQCATYKLFLNYFKAFCKLFTNYSKTICKPFFILCIITNEKHILTTVVESCGLSSLCCLCSYSSVFFPDLHRSCSVVNHFSLIMIFVYYLFVFCSFRLT